ncbi:MAG: phosphoglucosamine mutase [Bacteroidales bacterium]|jgi:phosphomannomutase|nr:phosphoglucosamine mutase [Bacteroidales bacterium]
MSSTLMKSVSGIRGIVGDSFTPELIVSVCSAFAKYVKYGTVIVGRDTRPTGDIISKQITSALALSGCNVIDIGIVPTPTVEIMVEHEKAAGGIVISASHNPIQWNAFKLINKDGVFLNSGEIAKVFAFMEEEKTYKPWNKIGTIKTSDKGDDIHIKAALSVVKTAAIKKQKFRVVLDAVNGAGSEITQRLLERLGCKVIPIHCTMDGTFPRGAEPVPANLKDLSEAVIKHKADVGFAQDPDADRLALVDEKGQPLGEEYTLALVLDHLLAKEKGPVVVNLSTTRATEDIANKYGVKFFRSKVGEINVTELMKKKKARIGGEGNGGVISPELHYGRDSLAGIVYILEMMAQQKKTVSQLKAALPQYVMVKGKVDFDPQKIDLSILETIAQDYSEERISNIDGLRIDFDKDAAFGGGWVHLRPSNTEPIFRIITEGKDAKQAKKIFNHFVKLFK